MKNIIQLFVIILFVFEFADAQSGVLIPLSEGDKPNWNILSIQKMDVDILIDNNHARVKITQIFNNKTAQILEGKYLFALPKTASIFDFATWENDLRIPGVMLEKHLANAIYQRSKSPKIDPAILQQDDVTSGFSAKVYPITPYGTKRLELEYTEELPVESFTSRFSLPLSPSWGEAQSAEELNIHLHVVNEFSMTSLELVGYQMQILRNEPNEYEADYRGLNVPLNNDLSYAYKINTQQDNLSFVAFRAPEKTTVYDLQDPRFASQIRDGFFETTALFVASAASTDAPKRIIVLLDTSLSMYGDKIGRAFEAIELLLHGLHETDEFNLLAFNDETNEFSEKPVAATPENVENALQFVKDKALFGGTNLKLALEKGIQQSEYFAEGARNIVLISDANPTLETTKITNIARIFDHKNTKLYAFAIGEEANTALLREICGQTKGDFTELRGTDDVGVSLKNFFERIGTPRIENLHFSSNNNQNLYDVYPTRTETIFGTSVSYVGRYQSAKQSTFNILGKFGSAEKIISQNISLPEYDETHSYLPRLWAKARVDALIQEMDVNGERSDYITEIIHLSRKYKFVSRYTAFIAAPRALLRPRIIQPGDPVLRLKTDSSIKKVLVILPFGETLQLRYLADEKVWEARFLAPENMEDGQYKCRILMTDQDGNAYQEEKTFIIDAHAPQPKIHLEKQIYHPGDEILLRVQSDKDTAKLTAKLFGAIPTQLFWSAQERINVGKIQIAKGLSPGKYVLSVTAEDFAHNLSKTEIEVQIQ